MSLSTYSDLQNQVKSFLHRNALLDAVGADNVPDLIRLAEARIGREVRSRLQEQRVSTTVTGTYINVPSDFIKMRAIFVTSSPHIKLDFLPADELLAAYTTTDTGTGKYYTIIGDEIRFGPLLSSGTTVQMWYFKRLAALSSAAHSLFTSNPDLYLYGTLATAAIYVKDDKRVAMWEQIYQSVARSVNATEKDGRYGAILEVRPQ